MLTDFDVGNGNMELFTRNNLAQNSGGGKKKAQAGLLAGLHIQEGKEMLDPAAQKQQLSLSI